MKAKQLTASIYNNMDKKTKDDLLSRGILNHDREGQELEKYDWLSVQEKLNLNEAFKDKKFDMNNNTYWSDYRKKH